MRRRSAEALSVPERTELGKALGSLYDVSGDGQRFLVNTRVGESVAPVTVVVNWMAELKK